MKLDRTRPKVMGILNATPDSFSDGGRFLVREQAVCAARQMAADGADIIDVGGESTRPGATPVSIQQELDRVIPVIEAIRADIPVAVSIDTSKPEVMRAAVSAGADMINDVRALRLPGALAAAAETKVPVCLMHMQGEPHQMQVAPHYEDVVSEVIGFLRQRIDACVLAGIQREQLLIDPGFGFGKTAAHNFLLLKDLKRLHELDASILVGMSRKSMIGAVLDVPVSERGNGSVVLATLACWMGAHIIRAHDVRPTVEAVKLCQAVKQGM